MTNDYFVQISYTKRFQICVWRGRCIPLCFNWNFRIYCIYLQHTIQIITQKKNRVKLISNIITGHYSQWVILRGENIENKIVRIYSKIIIPRKCFKLTNPTCKLFSPFHCRLYINICISDSVPTVRLPRTPTLSVIRQKDESQNGCFKKPKHAKFSEKRTFLPPDTHTYVTYKFWKVSFSSASPTALSSCLVNFIDSYHTNKICIYRT